MPNPMSSEPSRIDVANPRTGEVDYRFTPAEVAPVVAELRAAQPEWRRRGMEARAEALLRLADAVQAHRRSVIDALATDTGRTRIAAREVDGAVGTMRGWAAQAPHLLPPSAWTQGRAKPGMKHRVTMEPYGVVGVISPWNFPVTLSLIDTVPALLAGCTVAVKPSEITPRFVEPLRAAIGEAGLSDVLAFLPGDGRTGAELVAEADCICFTGSVDTGRRVALAAASHLVPINLELGGKDPLIVLPGTDVRLAARVALRASVLATGQACQSIERVYVPRDMHDAFLRELVKQAEAVPLALDGDAPGALGPFIDGRQAGKVAAQIADAVARGARVEAGGEVETHGGRWLRPTVLSGVTHGMEIMREETFGPVIPVMAYGTVDEAVALANDTEFGLSAAVFGPDLETCERVGERLEAGAVSLMDAALTNQYFEAPKQSFKNSGLGGSRMGPDGFARFFRKRALIANTVEPLPLESF